jgi:hypothetical protein
LVVGEAFSSSWIEVVGETVFDVDAADSVGVAADKSGRVDAGPAQVPGIRAKADHVGTEGVEQLNDLRLGLEDSADLGVVQRPQGLALENVTDDAAVLDGEREPVLVEVRTNGRLDHSGGNRHRRDHRPIQTQCHLIIGESFRAFHLVGDINSLVEGRAEQAKGWGPNRS